jgi:DNA-binding transcriptional regulator YdaS (Cro superfamily)
MDLKTYLADGERGRAAKLAQKLGIAPSYLSQMASGDSAISPKRCVLIEQETEGMVPRKDLRPLDWWELWPELQSATDQTPAVSETSV